MPVQTLAAVNDKDLQSYLSQLEWTKEELNAYMLSEYQSSIDEFETIEDLTDYLGEVLTEENLNEILLENELTKEELKALLVEYGDMKENEEILDVFPFYDDLFSLPEYYAEMTLISEENMNSLLTQFNFTKEGLEQLLADNGESLADYRFIEDLQYSVELYVENLSKTPITEASLEELLKKYDMTMEEFESLLIENDDSLEYYSYIEDLDMTLDFYINYQDMELPEMGDLGLSDEELERLTAYFEAFNEEDPVFMEKISALEEKYSFLEEWDFKSEDEISDEEVAQIYGLYQDVMALFNIELKFSLVKDGKSQSYSMEELMEMETTNGSDFIIEIYTTSGELLADMVLSAELMAEYESGGNPVDAVIEEVQDEVVQVATLIQKKSEAPNKFKTVVGAKLPKTASNMGLNMMLGLFMIIAGTWIYRKFVIKGV